MSGFKRATKAQAKLRCAVHGPSGSGKTFSCGRIATGLADGKPIAWIDTERGSASKYADHFTFDVLELDDKSIEGYVSAIKMAADAGYEVLIIDSLTHAWQVLIEEVDKLAKAKYRGNTWSAWSEGTPMQRKLVDAILRYPGHILATMRSKTEWQTTQDSNGRSRPQRVGLAPEQGKGVEYEFDLLLELSTDHIANVIKDRTGRFQDQLIDKPGEDFGRQLAEWLSDGEPVALPPPPPTATEEAINKARAAIQAATSDSQLKRYAAAIMQKQDDGFYTADQSNMLIALLDKQADSLMEGAAK